ncbi:AraC family transcriptional regulator [Lacticaseibacillus jixiensis]|uniref:AraC family transcriptional regulator n=1 Tax=Lacticaseibacillus jixiensis TaxID=3231926 RepID=UPI0036F20349
MRYLFQTPDQSLPLFVDSVGYAWAQDAMHRANGYPYVHWLQTEQGTGEVQVGSNRFTLAPHAGILINAGVPHSYSPLTPDWQTAYFTFGGALVKALLTTLAVRQYLFVPVLSPVLEGFIRTNAPTMQAAAPTARYASSALVYQFLLLIKQAQLGQTVEPQVAAAIITPIKALIEAQYATPLSNADFVALTHYSQQYITAVFRRYYGVTPHRLLTQVRVRHAKELLLNQPELSVSEVAQAVGFATVSYFIAQFKSSEHVTPKQFRQLYD